MKRTKSSILTTFLSVAILLINSFSLVGCGDNKASKNLKFSLSEDGKYYILRDVTECKDKEIVVPDSYKGLPVKEIGRLNNGFSLDGGEYIGPEKSIRIPKSVTCIREEAFMYAQFSNIEVDKNNPEYCSIDGHLYSKDKKTLIKYALGRNQAIYTIPDGVEMIADYAFKMTPYLGGVIIPDSVKCIGVEAFSNCAGLWYVEMGENVEEIQQGAFIGCTLTSIDLYDSLKKIGSWAFSRESCSLENGGYYIDQYLIEVDKSVSGTYTIEDGTILIADAAFSGCSELTQIVMTDTINIIGDYAFSECNNLTEIVYDGTVRQWNRVSKGMNNNWGKIAVRILH